VYDPQGSVQERQTDTAYSSGFAAYDRSTFEGYGALRQANKGSSGAGVGQPDPSGFGGWFGYDTDTDTGLLRLTHRYYDPGTGKHWLHAMISKWAWSQGMGQTQGENPRCR